MLKFPRITSFAPRLRFGLVLGLAFSGFGFQSGCDTAGKPAPLDTSLPPGARGPFLVEVAESGLSFTHFNGMSGHRYFCETVGAGGALFDFDQDGDLDLYVVQGAPLGPDPPQFPPDPGHPPGDRLYRNLHRESGELKFIDATVDAGIESLGYGMGCAVGDIEGDGDLDLYVTQFGKDRLWLNQGDGTFRDGTAAAGLGDPRWTTSAAFLDPDRDGDLDLFVCTYVDFTLENHKPCYSETSAIDYCGPSSYRPLPDRFYRNLGDGTFEDDSAVSRIGSLEGAGLGVVVTDLDGDGRLDIYVANDGTPNRLWRNLGDGTFEDIALLAGCAYNRDGRAEASMGIEAADFDGDGDEDIFLTHLTDETNTIYRNDGTGTFDDASAASGLGVPSRAYTGFGTALLDLEHDGDLDAVGGRAPVIVDGGFNRGSDIVKALAAGASLVGIGRMQCIGLAAGGQAGLVRLLEILEQEMRICLGLLGVNSWAELDRSYLHPAPPVGAGETLGAFPLLTLDEKSFY